MTASRRLWAPAAVVVTGAAVAVGAVFDDGGRGLLSALLGAGLVLGFLASGVLPLLLVRGGGVPAGAGAGLLLLTYTLRLAVAVAVLRVAGRSDAVAPRWTAYAVVACALAWALATAVAVLRDDPPGHGLPAAGR